MEENRDEILRVYVSESNKQEIRKEAREQGMPVSTYCRHKILNKEKIEVEA